MFCTFILITVYKNSSSENPLMLRKKLK